MRRVLLDTRPLAVSRDFRRLWMGQAVSFLGTMITSAALPYQVYHQTGSSFAVGVLGVVQLMPLLAFSLLGGALADGVDKRRLLLVITALSLVTTTSLAANASLDRPQLWLLYVLGAVSSAIASVSFAVLRSLLPLLLDGELRPAGFALQSTYGSFGMMAGPALAGVLIAARGLSTAYAVDLATYLVALAMFAGIAPAPPVAGGVDGVGADAGAGAGGGAGGASLRALASSTLEGLRFLQGHAMVLSIFGLDLLAMTFGMPRALFPALADRLGGGARLYGLLWAAVAAGAFLASLTSGWTTNVRRQGRAVLLAVSVWGAAVALAGLVRLPGVVLVMLAVAGGADMVSGVFRSTIAAAVTPDSLRGRVSGIEFAVYAGGPVVGDVEAGLVGGVAGVPFAIVSGGLACVVAAVAFAVWVPRFAGYVAPGRSSASSTSPPATTGPAEAEAEVEALAAEL
jgi:MFS family permease